MSPIHLYGGPCDGAEATVLTVVKCVILPAATYDHSAAWSAYFGRRTFVPLGFKGKPPVQHV